MALTKQVLFGQLSILQDMSLQIREDTLIFEDGKQLSSTYHRSILIPGDNVSTQPKIIQDLAALLWTPEVIAAAQARKAEERAKIEASMHLPGVN